MTKRKRRRHTRKYRNKGGNGKSHPTGLGDGDQRKIDQYLEEEGIQIHDAQDPRVLDEAALIEAGDIEAMARRDAAVERLQAQLDALSEPPEWYELQRRLRALRSDMADLGYAVPAGPLPVALEVPGEFVGDLPVAPRAGGRRRRKRKTRKRRRKRRTRRRRRRR